jgi:hypothetical protein
LGNSINAGTLNSSFVSQATLNGSGTSISYGVLKPWSATNAPKICASTTWPPNVSNVNTFVKVPSITGACNTSLTDNVSVATFPGPKMATSLLQCNDGLALVLQASPTPWGSRIVADLCPACNTGFNGAQGQIDNFTNNSACNARGTIGDLGFFYTSDVK